ncbi:hypothetical protein B5G43_02500 [Flavonifractor sp. An92]|uniref:hypothetical protein n=1 Tax=Flavonifractor sp. An92 TaxID=1965666 RepID=UPI000B3A6FF1|nr:hypothetical protein [Flavonifractor sp. An92]OUN08272.1 hypothetical protein B5G43_02500 [Flavonifractor sp. An92]
MKWFNVWFLLSGVWIVIAILNLVQGREGTLIAFNIFAVILFAALGGVQNYAAKQDQEGKKLLRRVYAIVILALILFLGVLIVRSLLQG